MRRTRREALTKRRHLGEGHMPGKIGLTEIILIVGIALLLFGPSKFASLGKSIGEGLRNFKTAMKEDPDNKDESKKA